MENDFYRDVFRINYCVNNYLENSIKEEKMEEINLDYKELSKYIRSCTSGMLMNLFDLIIDEMARRNKERRKREVEAEKKLYDNLDFVEYGVRNND